MAEALLSRIARGDTVAVGEFLRCHAAMVWNQARRSFRSVQDAEDAVQDIFLEIWRNADRYDAQQGSERAFVMTIARRRIIDRMRRQAVHLPVDRLEDPAMVPAAVEPDPVDLDEELVRARAAMHQLRPEQRQVLELALGHGRSHAEIAAAVGIPLGTVKSHARRGLMRLREMLGVSDGEGGEP